MLTDSLSQWTLSAPLPSTAPSRLATHGCFRSAATALHGSWRGWACQQSSAQASVCAIYRLVRLRDCWRSLLYRLLVHLHLSLAVSQFYVVSIAESRQ